MVSMAAAALAYLWLGLADALWMLFAARRLAGACAGNIAAANAYIADVTPPEKRARGMGMIGAALRPRLYHRAGAGRDARRRQSRDRRSAQPGLPRLRSVGASRFLGVLRVLKESLRARPRAAVRARARIAALREALAPQDAGALIC